LNVCLVTAYIYIRLFTSLHKDNHPLSDSLWLLINIWLASYSFKTLGTTQIQLKSSCVQ